MAAFNSEASSSATIKIPWYYGFGPNSIALLTVSYIPWSLEDPERQVVKWFKTQFSAPVNCYPSLAVLFFYLFPDPMTSLTTLSALHFI